MWAGRNTFQTFSQGSAGGILKQSRCLGNSMACLNLWLWMIVAERHREPLGATSRTRTRINYSTFIKQVKYIKSTLDGPTSS